MWFDVVCETSGKTVRLFGEDATEVAKYYGMYLKHLGVLKSYEEVNTPCKVMVKWIAGHACFNTWYTKQTMDTRHQGTTVIVECCFVKKVLLNILEVTIARKVLPHPQGSKAACTIF